MRDPKFPRKSPRERATAEGTRRIARPAVASPACQPPPKRRTPSRGASHMNRSHLPVLIVLTVLALPGRASAQAPLKELIVPAGGNVGQNFSPAIRTGNLLFVTGQVGPGDDVAAQTRATLERIKTLVEA